MNRILIIDDDKELCALIRQSVLQESIEADCCYSGKSGLLQLKEKEYQLVILDVMLPGFDGFGSFGEISAGSDSSAFATVPPTLRTAHTQYE